MRKRCVSSLLGALLAVSVSCSLGHAASCEFHGGVYSSWEYRDNYLGTAHNRRSDTIYEIGPSAEIVCRAQPFTWNLSGHVARSYHNRFDEDDSTEIDLTSGLAAVGRRDSLELEYAFVQTTEEDFFSDISGETRIHTGAISYSRTLSSLSTLGVGYTYRLEDNTFPEQDIESHGASGTFSHRITPRNTVSLTAGYNTYDYDITPDAQVLRSTLSFEHAWSPRTDVGVDLEYQHQYREEDLPDSDIKSAYLFWSYALTPQTRVLLSGGYSWLNMEDMDRERAFVARGEITHAWQRNTFRLAASREYTAEFTTDEYGTYDIRRASASWERGLLRSLSLLTTITYVERKPIAGIDMTEIERQEEKDTAGMISLVWAPIRYITMTSSYERLREVEEISDTVVENRYRIIVEVLY
ncbi:MAG TPA: hypothetical protein PLE36_09645 [Deltaproteobacteria bacterium]|nr:hypothetical protein [Bacteriovoracaceae bacterium]HQM20876.1 hypothetical protein [Deltaproteobacteria bacterium]